MSLIDAVSIGLLGSAIFGSALTISGIGIGCLIGRCPFDERDLAASMADVEIPMLVQVNDTNLRGSDLTKLHGLVVNLTDIPSGQTVFGSESFNNAHGRLMHQMNANSPAGLHVGELSFPIPGVEPETLARGTWIVVDPSTADEKTQKSFLKLHKAVKAARTKDHPSTPAELMEMLSDSEDYIKPESFAFGSEVITFRSRGGG